MADSKITALAALTTADPANDMFPVVDVSDTSMAASGTTKRISINNILACSPSATLASATITGDLTVDTSTLKVDSTNNRVGIATATPGVRVDIVSDSNTSLAPVLRVNSNNVAVSTSLAYDGLIGSSTLTIQSGTSAAMIFNTNNVNERYRIASDGVATWSNVGGVAGTAMTLNATGLGIGLSPTYKLQSVGIAAATSSTVNGSGGNLIGALLNSDDANSGVNPGVDLRRWTGSALNHGLTYIATNATGDTLFYNGTAASNTRATSLKMTLDASGNLILLSPSTPPTLATNGELTVNATSNTNLRFSYRGSDGTTRVANLTLA